VGIVAILEKPGGTAHTQLLLENVGWLKIGNRTRNSSAEAIQASSCECHD
jgi:hypothetical protein